jgi:hypothetical protein
MQTAVVMQVSLIVVQMKLVGMEIAFLVDGLVMDMLIVVLALMKQIVPPLNTHVVMEYVTLN